MPGKLPLASRNEADKKLTFSTVFDAVLLRLIKKDMTILTPIGPALSNLKCPPGCYLSYCEFLLIEHL